MADSYRKGSKIHLGKLVVDAAEPLALRITTHDIRNATQMDPDNCAIAQSARKKKGIVSAHVGAQIVLVEYEDVVRRYALSSQDANMVKAFDKANWFMPGEVVLQPPPERIQLGAQAGKGGNRPGTGEGTPSVYRHRRTPSRHF